MARSRAYTASSALSVGDGEGELAMDSDDSDDVACVFA